MWKRNLETFEKASKGNFLSEEYEIQRFKILNAILKNCVEKNTVLSVFRYFNTSYQRISDTKIHVLLETWISLNYLLSWRYCASIDTRTRAKNKNGGQLTGSEAYQSQPRSSFSGYRRREIKQLIISDHFPVTQLSFSRHRRVIGRE